MESWQGRGLTLLFSSAVFVSLFGIVASVVLLHRHSELRKFFNFWFFLSAVLMTGILAFSVWRFFLPWMRQQS